MISYRVTTAVVALSIAGCILLLLRRDKLHTLYSAWWLCTAAFIVVLGLFPKLFDAIGVALGIRYPPVLALTLAIGLLLIKILTMDMERTRQEKQLRLLAQRLALLEGALSGSDAPTVRRPPTPASGQPEGDSFQGSR